MDEAGLAIAVATKVAISGGKSCEVRLRGPADIMDRSTAMESAAFRKWLAAQGCRFDRHEHQQRGQGHVVVTVHREGRKAEVPLGGSRQTLDLHVVRRACEELGLDWSQLPGPKSRV